ncbi:molybdopterin converting factor subunit 1 [Roseococcus sp. DSY-14]|uniref:molybdopterin converting factor subunit 1 n=1 Tax=Roseococcus sp. DSY-14 TaxID=3369650 RepID=UPI00387B7B1A
MKLLYFAWLREKVGLAEEEMPLPEGVRDVAGLMAHLATRSPGHAAGFANPSALRCAVNQDFATPSDPVREGDEVAFFPPVTGG